MLKGEGEFMISIPDLKISRWNANIIFLIIYVLFWINNSLIYYVIWITQTIHWTITSRFTVTFYFFTIIIIIIIIYSVTKFINKKINWKDLVPQNLKKSCYFFRVFENLKNA